MKTDKASKSIPKFQLVTANMPSSRFGRSRLAALMVAGTLWGMHPSIGADNLNELVFQSTYGKKDDRKKAIANLAERKEEAVQALCLAIAYAEFGDDQIRCADALRELRPNPELLKASLPSGAGRLAKGFIADLRFEFRPPGDQAVIDALSGRDVLYAMSALQWCLEHREFLERQPFLERLLNTFAEGTTPTKIIIYDLLVRSAVIAVPEGRTMFAGIAQDGKIASTRTVARILLLLSDSKDDVASLVQALDGPAAGRWISCVRLPYVARLSNEFKTTTLSKVAADDSEPSVKDAALIGLGILGAESEDATVILQRLGAELNNPRYRGLAIRAIGRIGPGALSAVPRLRTLLGDCEHRGEATRALSSIGRGAADAIPDLEQVDLDAVGDDAHDASIAIRTISGELRATRIRVGLRDFVYPPR